MRGHIRSAGALAVVLGLALVLGAGPAAAQAAAQAAASVDRGRQWLEQQRKPDGSFDDGVFNPVDLTTNATMAEVAAGATPTPATLAWLRDSSAVAEYAKKGPGSAAKLALALESAGGDAGALLTTIGGAANGDSFKGAAGDYDVALAALALRGGGRAVPAAILDGLASRQAGDGGWSFAKGQPSDTNTTAVALMALAANDRGGSPAVPRGVGFLDGQQFASGGWGYDRRSKDVKAMDANSTGLVLSALSAVGVDQGTKARAGVSPRDALLGLQVPSGGFVLSADKVKAGTADQFATSQALVGLAGKTLPVERQQPARAEVKSGNPLQLVLIVVVAVAALVAGAGVLVSRRRA